MELKTFRAKSMAEALAAVRSSLGADAVILHTRHAKTGGLFGLGARRIVEVMASSASSAHRAPRGAGPAQRAAPPRPGARPAARPASAPVAARPAGPPAPLRPQAVVASAVAAEAAPFPAARPAPTDPKAGPVTMRVRRTGPRPPEPAPRPSMAEARSAVAVENVSAASVESELAAIRGLLAQTLECSRRSLATSAGVTTGSMTDALTKQYLTMLEREVASDIADDIVGRVRDELTPAELADGQIVRETVLRRIAAMAPVAEDVPSRQLAGRPRTIALIGPTGVGKTTTVAKLAASYRLRHGKRVGLITTDTYRIAAVDQLRTYANIIGVPVRVALTGPEMRTACDALADCDIVLIDTAGRSQRDSERLAELRAFLDAAEPHETHLVLSCTSSGSTMLEAARKFGALGPNRIIFTKLDEAVNLGVLLSVVQRVNLKLSYLTTGQEVPDHLEPSRPERIARLVLDGVAQPAEATA